MILVFTAPDQDYAADYLTHGFVSLLGADRVVEYPRKPSLHLSGDPVFDCDMNLATADMSYEGVRAALHDGSFKLIVIPSMRQPLPGMLHAWRELLRRNADRIVFVDGEDHANNMQPLVNEIIGFRPVENFKRELPIGETWAKPLPFGYPEERIVDVDSRLRFGAVYAVEIWPWARGKLRERIGQELQDEQDVAVRMTYDGQRRLPIHEYHDLNRRSVVAVSPAGQGYHTNRHLDVIADGCCPVLERPWRQWPQAPQDPVMCRYFANEIQASEIVRDLLADTAYATAIAKNAQEWLRKCATTKVRARAVWESVHGAIREAA